MIATNIRQVLKLSKLCVIGRAKNNGIERTKSIVESSTGVQSTYRANPAAKYSDATLGRIPSTTKTNIASSATNTVFNSLRIDDF